jgi:cellulose synthase/poly-beta-1,6-N-acetylglucosamine synthase-like glycosyltransferase
MTAEHVVVLALSFLLTLLFFPYGFNYYFLGRRARKERQEQQERQARPAVQSLELPPGVRPAVAVHLPLYNERYVAERLIAACARMARSYGAERVRILVIDDSTDQTRAVVDRAAARERAAGLRIEVLRRGGRPGFKAGALAFALDRTWEEYVAVFDADFTPVEDFLLRAVPVLHADPRVGVVQGRWRHLNERYNGLTRAVAIGIDAHFLIEQAGRHAGGLFLNFNGSGGVLRRSALVEAGGWQWDTLAEDLDISYRIQLRGFRVAYRADLACPAEVPPTVPAFRKQQARWACGSLRVARKLLHGLLRRTDLRPGLKLQASIHLTQYALHPLMFLSFLLACFVAFRGLAVLTPISLLRLSPGAQSGSVIATTAAWALAAASIAACSAAPWAHAASAVRASGRRMWGSLPSLLLLGLVGGGLSANNSVEAAKALFSNRAWSFQRTPKYAVRRSTDDWRAKRYQVAVDLSGSIEAGAALLGLASAARAAASGQWLLVPIIGAYTAGFAVVAAGTLAQSRGGRGGRIRGAAP